MTFEELREVYLRYLYLDDDPDILRLLYGAYCANFYDGNPVWIMFIGDSGTGKSELLMSMSESSNSVAVSSLTSKSLLSGYKGDVEESSLLPKLNKKILIIKDLSTITEVNPQERTEVFSLLRDAYDGHCVRNTGRGTVEFHGKFGLLAAATKAIEYSRRMDPILGERFLHLRTRTRNRKILEVSRRNVTRKEEMRSILREASKTFLDGWETPEGKMLPRSVVDLAEEAAGVLCRSRSTVIRDSYSKEICFPVEYTEVPTRVYDQLMLTASAMRYLGAEQEELERAMRRLMVDSMPYPRLRILQSLLTLKDTSVSSVASTIKMARTIVDRHFDDMDKLGIIQKGKSGYTIQSELLSKSILECPLGSENNA